jgi:hypothetical protein
MGRKDKLNKYFSPAAVSVKGALFGRDDILEEVVDLISEKSYHLIVTGERGVGKSSLLKTADSEIQKFKDEISIEYKCTGVNDFNSICYELYTASGATDHPETFSPHNVVKMLVLRKISGHIVIDEFDIATDYDKGLITQLCKHIGEAGCKFTFCFCEAIDIPDVFYRSHPSIKRYVRRLFLTGISSEHSSEIVNNALISEGLIPLNPQLEAILFYITQGIPFRVKQLGKHIIETLLDNNVKTLNGQYLKLAIELTLAMHYKDEHEMLVEIFKHRKYGGICKNFLISASNVSLNDFFDYREIYKQLIVEMEGGEITEELYLQALNFLYKDYAIINKRAHQGRKYQVYFKDYSYPFVIRLLEQIY